MLLASRKLLSIFQLFELSLRACKAIFSVLTESTIQNVDLKAHRSRIEAMYNRLAAIKGVEYTGAGKVLHLMLPELFVPWDAYIRGEKETKVYPQLPCVLSKKWCLVRYDQTGCGYVDFLSDMQARVRHLEYNGRNKPLPKNLDEWNYVQITIPIQAEEDRRRKQKSTRTRVTHRYG